MSARITIEPYRAGVAGDAYSCFEALRRLKELGAPVLGKAWPATVTTGALVYELDELDQELVITWTDEVPAGVKLICEMDPEKRDEWYRGNAVLLFKQVQYEFHKQGHKLLGAVWPIGLSEGKFVVFYDDCFDTYQFGVLT